MKSGACDCNRMPHADTSLKTKRSLFHVLTSAYASSLCVWHASTSNSNC